MCTLQPIRYLFLLIIWYLISYQAVAQTTLSETAIDSLIHISEENSEENISLDTGTYRVDGNILHYRNSYAQNKNLGMITYASAVMEEKTMMGFVRLYYFYENKLLKVESFNISIDYKKFNFNLTYFNQKYVDLKTKQGQEQAQFIATGMQLLRCFRKE